MDIIYRDGVGLSICMLCSASVVERNVHTKWHETLLRQLQQALGGR